MKILLPFLGSLALATATHAEEVRPLPELLAALSCDPGPIDGR